eukprot:TRINITY_DN8092_c2_g1_i1.p1 TRINITY_DN8092_c2_g1~~TRINITY_DN8092_c2_g1_i1.p1  ORF type:complete len:319 (+),score=17.69 TRINITY_DN8092_c2_g1_i1:68-1024(+)
MVSAEVVPTATSPTPPALLADPDEPASPKISEEALPPDWDAVTQPEDAWSLWHARRERVCDCLLPWNRCKACNCYEAQTARRLFELRDLDDLISVASSSHTLGAKRRPLYERGTPSITAAPFAVPASDQVAPASELQQRTASLPPTKSPESQLPPQRSPLAPPLPANPHPPVRPVSTPAPSVQPPGGGVPLLHPSLVPWPVQMWPPYPHPLVVHPDMKHLITVGGHLLPSLPVPATAPVMPIPVLTQAPAPAPAEGIGAAEEEPRRRRRRRRRRRHRRRRRRRRRGGGGEDGDEGDGASSDSSGSSDSGDLSDSDGEL